jgi:hypothetical protein
MNSLVWFVANNFWIGLVWLVDIQLCSWVGFTLDFRAFRIKYKLLDTNMSMFIICNAGMEPSL